MDFLDTLKVVDDAVDAYLSETGIVIFEGVVHHVKGPLDRDIYTDEASSARTGSIVSTFSFQRGTVPEDSRDGYLSCRGELFKIEDYDAPRDGRTVLILRRVYEIDNISQFAGYPYPFIQSGNSVIVDGYPYAYPIIGY